MTNTHRETISNKVRLLTIIHSNNFASSRQTHTLRNAQTDLPTVVSVGIVHIELDLLVIVALYQ